MSAARTSLRAPSIILGAILCVSAPISVRAQSRPEQGNQPQPETQPQSQPQQLPAAGSEAALPALDPSTEMAPMPGMEVGWPEADLAVPSPVANAPGASPVAAQTGDAA